MVEPSHEVFLLLKVLFMPGLSVCSRARCHERPARIAGYVAAALRARAPQQIIPIAASVFCVVLSGCGMIIF